MHHPSDNRFLNVINGTARGPGATLLRTALAAVEPFYAGVMRLRNRLFNSGLLRVVRLGRPVISIGNLTTGGTGKTPMVRWLAASLRDRGQKVAVLSRGYKSAVGQLGDEQIMLDRLLNRPSLTPIVLKANPNRMEAARAALEERPETDLFLLDDGFQHRRVARDLDIVLLSAADPFGGGHVLPRGLLREPRAGLRRADAVVITHADAVAEPVLAGIEASVRRHHPQVPIYRAVHAQTGLRTAGASSALAPDRSIEDLRGRRFFAFGGIGNPRVLQRQLEALPGACIGTRWYPDHHAYVPADLADLKAHAAAQNADLLLTTEKDWVKVGAISEAMNFTPEIWRIDVELRWREDGEKQLLNQVLAAFGG